VDFTFLLWFLPISALSGILILYVFVCWKIGEAAAKKNRNANTFFWLSLLVSPLLMGIIVAVMTKPDKK
jgi:hypothetical protein